ncbi:hypothetical protein Afil01_11540 [Actinorhabdospora filicis]|uniref:TIGR03086 family protein n=2 Tax=Actinorhabdospora filicis TaxID=1785913 RepID=A0A9W6SI27_9ACTN|nr:hypothetical protein Afil01_11540 [Actinorhabdospora filicis]
MKRAAAEAAAVARAVGDVDLDAPTPSADWDTRALLNHWVLWTSHALEKRALREPFGEELTGRDFASEPGWRQEYLKHLDAGVRAWSRPGALDGDIDTGGGAMAAADVASMLTLELVLHTWDVAKATGVDYDPDFGTEFLPVVEKWADMYRQYEGFGDTVETPEGTSALDRALALSGRDPKWAA